MTGAAPVNERASAQRQFYSPKTCRQRREKSSERDFLARYSLRSHEGTTAVVRGAVPLTHTLGHTRSVPYTHTPTGTRTHRTVRWKSARRAPAHAVGLMKAWLGARWFAQNLNGGAVASPRRTRQGVQAQVPKWTEHRASLALVPSSMHVTSRPCPCTGHHSCSVAGTAPASNGERLTAFAQSDSCGRGDTQTLPVITTLPQLEDAGGGPRCASVRVSGGGSSSSAHSEAMLSHRPTNWPHTQGLHFTCSSNSMPCPSGRMRRH